METDLTDFLDLDGPPIPATMGEAELATLLGVEPSRIRTLARDKVIVRTERGRFDVATSFAAKSQPMRGTRGRPSGSDA